ncbi:MAG: flagellar biosynthesis protein FlhB, partial [Planctomycetota bacterium]
MAESSGDKKHFASERKRRQAREQGNVVKSQDLTSAAMLMAAVAIMKFVGPKAATSISSMIETSLGGSEITSPTVADAVAMLVRVTVQLSMIVVPVLGCMFLAGIAFNVSQTGILFSTEKLAPKLSHINPLSGVKRILSLQGLMRLSFGLFKVAIIGAVAFLAVRSYGTAVMGLAGVSAGTIGPVIFDVLTGTCLWIGGALLILALLEYAFQRWKFEQDLMMTDQELRDEMKETEGDPQVAARRKQVQRQMMMQRAETDVPKADVVVSNPTELAIAIQYDPTTMPAPVVLAKGAGTLAQKIRRVALKHGVPVVERKPLAQFLYKNVEVGEVIPADQYQAVAEVLRYVYQLQGKEIP